MRQKRKRLGRIQFGVLVAVLMIFLDLGIVFAASDEEAEEGKDKVQIETMVKPDNIYTKGYDVVFCVDNSGSVWDQQEVRDEALRSIANLAVGSDIRIGGVYFGDKIYSKQTLTSMEDTEGSQKIIREFLNMTEQDKKNWDTNIGMALEEAISLFDNQDSSRKRIVILFSDGINENEEKSSLFKKWANMQTFSQVQILGEMDIPIYCVYLEKKENDEEYLKDLVNYFDSDNSYDEDRFKKVTESEIDTLSEEFAKIFYSMQNDMKFREISMDSSGELSFYVPEMGVKKLQIYLKNDVQYEAELNSPDGKGDAENWKDGNNTYITVENPEEGDWTLKINGDDKEYTRGTIAYYTDISADVELVSEQEDDGKAYKNDTQKLRVRFFDKDAKEIEANTVAEVSADVTLESEDGRMIRKEMQLESSDNGYESDGFTWEEYGKYDIEITVIYEDFLDLVYHRDGKVEKRAPIVYNKANEIYWALGTEDGETFTFKTSELYTDPDGEKVEIIDVVQINEKNPVAVAEKDGYIRVTAKDTGEIKFALNLKDSSGKTADVTIQGTVQDKLTAKIVLCIILIFMILILLGVFIYIKRSKHLYESMQNEGEDFKKTYSRILNVFEGFQKKTQDERQAEQELKNAYNTLKELCEEQLPEELRQDYNAYLKSDFIENQIRPIRKIEGNIKNKKAALDIRSNQIESCIKTVSKMQVNYRFRQVQAYMKEISEAESYFQNSINAYDEELAKVKNEAEKISQMGCELGELLEEPVNCSMELIYGKSIGAKVCRNLKGGFSLDEVQMLSEDSASRTLGDILCGESTGIYVFGYEDNYNNAGLKLMSARTFKIRNASEGKDRHEKTAELLGGEIYKVTPDNMGMITIRVEEENSYV